MRPDHHHVSHHSLWLLHALPSEFSSMCTAEISRIPSAGSAVDISSPPWVRGKLYLLHSPLTRSSLANRRMTSSLKPERYILINRIDLKSCMDPYLLSQSCMGILNWYQLTVDF